MKKSILTVLLLAAIIANAFVTRAQYATSIHQDFDASCAISTGFPSGWMYYNPIPSTDPTGAWHCSPTMGRMNDLGSPTPGITCTGVWSTAYHVDTSYFISPQLYLGSYSHMYLYFDTKADSVTLGGKLSILFTYDTGMPSTFIYTDSTFSLLSPAFGPADSAGWITHMFDLTGRCGPSAHPFYIAFRYVSPTTYGSAWYIDNINTRTTLLGVPETNKDIMQLTVLGSSTTSRITLSPGSLDAGKYDLAICDLMGRVVHRQSITVSGHGEAVTLDGLELVPGMYIIKAGNEAAYGMTKVIVQ